MSKRDRNQERERRESDEPKGDEPKGDTDAKTADTTDEATNERVADVKKPEPPDAARITEALADAGARKPAAVPSVPPRQVRDASQIRRG